jgi:hypothetical protein
MAKRRTLNSFKKFSDVFEKEKDFESLRQTVKNYDVVFEFEKIFPELSLIAKAVKVDNQILFLKVENSVWKSELNFQKARLIEKINKHFNTKALKGIKFL